ncbi:MAG: septum site-determining protein MinD [Ruminococcaceae bacterium]|nr:septum site-determining protein MinD [Oscillospiraceae bacterium]
MVGCIAPVILESEVLSPAMDNLPEINNAIPDTTEVRLITSAKGGVGKSTVCANLGAALAESGQQVLLIDCDVANRCLDLMLGLQDEVLYGIRDVCAGEIALNDAIYASPAIPSLHLLPGSRLTTEDISIVTEALPACIAEARTHGYDHILIDTPGGLHDILFAAADLVGEALIVSSAQTTAIRSAEQTAALLEEHGVTELHLIVNQYMAAAALAPKPFRSRRGRKPSKRAMNEAVLPLISAVDAVSLTLLGVIPFDAELWDAQNRGYLICHPSLSDTLFAAAHRNIAKRIAGRTVPLFSDN